MTFSRLSLCIALVGMSSTAIAQNQNTSYYVEAGTSSTQRETDPPSYVKRLGGDLAWLDFGLQQRLRYEYRDDDIRRFEVEGHDDPLLSRTRVYFGARSRIEPLRFALEFTDGRRFNSRFAPDNRDTDKHEFIQGYVELRYDTVFAADPRGNARPLTIRYGRQAFELLDRRLMARNEWRNTTNSFEGVRVGLGQDSNDWQLEAMSFNPVTRLFSDVDEADKHLRFNALVAHWRAWPRLTLEPHYFQIKQDAAPSNGNRERDIRALGLRAYGKTADNVINYEVTAMSQSGDEGVQDQDAHSFTAEVGYTWLQHPWRPRLAAFYGYASGDNSPLDRESNRFDRFFGFARPWSPIEYAIYENLRAPKLRVEFQPVQGYRVDIGYGAYWLASSRDRFTNLLGGTAFNRDASGRSGDFVGQEIDGRVRFSLGEYFDVALGYSHFLHDEFIENRQRAALGRSADDSDFAYLELTYSLF